MKAANQGSIFKSKLNTLTRAAILIFIILITLGCNSKKETGSEAAKPSVPQAAKPSAEEPLSEMPAPAVSMGEPKGVPPLSSGDIVQVNGVKLTKSRFEGELKRKMDLLKDQMPADRLEKMKPEIKKQLIDEFVIRTLLSQEVARLKIDATEKEVAESMDRVKNGLPPGASLDDLLKKNQLTKEKFREEMALGVKINRLVLSQPQANVKPSEKEITKYYQDNKEKFKMPETVHARHILLAKKPGEDEKTKLERKTKAETLRKQLLDGADFADVAAKNSDDPNKTSGGDLGSFPRGQMVKPFEDAAFSQKVNAIGPVVETDFGYHIIQILAHNEPKIISLDKKIKEEIGNFLLQQKRQETFTDLLKKLRAKATIIVSGQ